MLHTIRLGHQGAWQLILTLLFVMSPWMGAETILSTQSSARHVDFKTVNASPEVRRLVERILATQNHQDLPFVVLDKNHAQIFVFDSTGQLHGSAPALIGFAVGDDPVPGIGSRELSHIRWDEKTTPAGRFVGNLDRNLAGHPILWVDYEAAISLHSVVTDNPAEQRARRLASKTSDDNRISFGCINVSNAFFQYVVAPAFKGTYGIVYILPDTHAIQDVFSFYEP